MTKDGYMTITETVNHLKSLDIKCSSMTVRNWITGKQVAGYKIGGRWYIQKSDLLNFIGMGEE